ncbi:MAG: hypothetical protein GVY11_07240 [Gammaproteobacteria bacterium]|jgi:hypothetical protein|nr:hypothetical protein [Gammaproteobacteria bacterium]
MKRILLAVVVAVFSIPATAAGESCGSEEIILQHIDGPVTLGDDSLTSLSSAWNSEDDELLLTWRSDDTSFLLGQRFEPDLTPIDTAPIVLEESSVVSPISTYNKGSNRYAVAWRTEDEDVGPMDSLVGKVFDSGLGVVGTRQNLSGESGGFEPWIAPFGDDFVASSRFHVRAYELNADGTSGSTSEALGAKVALPNGSIAENPGANEYLVTWRDQINSRLAGAILSDDLSTDVSPFGISENLPDSQRAAYTFFNASEEQYIVVFDSFFTTEVFARRIDADGNVLGSSDIQLIAGEEVLWNSFIRAAWLPDIEGFVVIRPEPNAAETAFVSPIRVFSAEGELLHAPVALPTGPGEEVGQVDTALFVAERNELIVTAPLNNFEGRETRTAAWRYALSRCPEIHRDRFQN